MWSLLECNVSALGSLDSERRRAGVRSWLTLIQKFPTSCALSCHHPGPPPHKTSFRWGYAYQSSSLHLYWLFQVHLVLLNYSDSKRRALSLYMNRALKFPQAFSFVCCETTAQKLPHVSKLCKIGAWTHKMSQRATWGSKWQAEFCTVCAALLPSREWPCPSQALSLLQGTQGSCLFCARLTFNGKWLWFLPEVHWILKATKLSIGD